MSLVVDFGTLGNTRESTEFVHVINCCVVWGLIYHSTCIGNHHSVNNVRIRLVIKGCINTCLIVNLSGYLCHRFTRNMKHCQWSTCTVNQLTFQRTYRPWHWLNQFEVFCFILFVCYVILIFVKAHDANKLHTCVMA